MDEIRKYTVSNKELIENMVKSIDNYSKKVDAYSQKVDVLIHQNDKTLSLLSDLVKKLIEDKIEEKKKKEPQNKEDEVKKRKKKIKIFVILFNYFFK